MGTTLQNNLPTALASLGSGSIKDKNGNAISMENWRENPQVKIEIPPKEKFQRYKKTFVRYEQKILPKYQNKTLDESIWFDFNRDQSIWFEIPKNQEKSVSFEMKNMKNNDCETLQKDSNKSESQEILKKNQNT